MTRYGFTATRDLTDDGERETITSVLDTLTDATEFTTGGAIGGDAFIASYLAMRYTTYMRLILPANPSQVDYSTIGWADEVAQMREGTTYRDRNLRILEHSDHLIGFPKYPEDHRKSKRSGTWQTIRLARKAQIPTTVHILHPYIYV